MVAEAIAKEASAKGVVFRPQSPVSNVCVRSGRAEGVVLEDGTEFAARCVIANVNPRLLYLNILESDTDADASHPY